MVRETVVVERDDDDEVEDAEDEDEDASEEDREGDVEFEERDREINAEQVTADSLEKATNVALQASQRLTDLMHKQNRLTSVSVSVPMTPTRKRVDEERSSSAQTHITALHVVSDVVDGDGEEHSDKRAKIM